MPHDVSVGIENADRRDIGGEQSLLPPASRSRADGSKTDGASGCLLSSIGRNGTRSFLEVDRE